MSKHRFTIEIDIEAGCLEDAYQKLLERLSTLDDAWQTTNDAWYMDRQDGPVPVTAQYFDSVRRYIWEQVPPLKGNFRERKKVQDDS